MSRTIAPRATRAAAPPRSDANRGADRGAGRTDGQPSGTIRTRNEGSVTTSDPNAQVSQQRSTVVNGQPRTDADSFGD